MCAQTHLVHRRDRASLPRLIEHHGIADVDGYGRFGKQVHVLPQPQGLAGREPTQRYAGHALVENPAVVAAACGSVYWYAARPGS